LGGGNPHRFGDGRDLFDHVDAFPQGLDVSEVRSTLGQIASAVAFLHSHNIVHRDIKDENVILDGRGGVQLIDFGSAAYVKDGRKFDTFSGTLESVVPSLSSISKRKS
jgi:protein-serine/threonine kinase